MVTILTILGWWPCGHHPRMVRMVTISHLPEAPNPKVGPPTLHQPRTYTIVSFDSYSIFWSILGGGSQKPYSRRVPMYQIFSSGIDIWQGYQWNNSYNKIQGNQNFIHNGGDEYGKVFWINSELCKSQSLCLFFCKKYPNSTKWKIVITPFQNSKSGEVGWQRHLTPYVSYVPMCLGVSGWSSFQGN